MPNTPKINAEGKKEFNPPKKIAPSFLTGAEKAWVLEQIERRLLNNEPRVKVFREILGLSASEFAVKLGVTTGYVSGLDKARWSLGNQNRFKASKILGVDPASLADSYEVPNGKAAENVNNHVAEEL